MPRPRRSTRVGTGQKVDKVLCEKAVTIVDPKDADLEIQEEDDAQLDSELHSYLISEANGTTLRSDKEILKERGHVIHSHEPQLQRRLQRLRLLWAFIFGLSLLCTLRSPKFFASAPFEAQVFANFTRDLSLDEVLTEALRTLNEIPQTAWADDSIEALQTQVENSQIHHRRAIVSHLDSYLDELYSVYFHFDQRNHRLMNFAFNVSDWKKERNILSRRPRMPWDRMATFLGASQSRPDGDTVLISLHKDVTELENDLAVKIEEEDLLRTNLDKEYEHIQEVKRLVARAPGVSEADRIKILEGNEALPRLWVMAGGSDTDKVSPANQIQKLKEVHNMWSDIQRSRHLQKGHLESMQRKVQGFRRKICSHKAKQVIAQHERSGAAQKTPAPQDEKVDEGDDDAGAGVEDTWEKEGDQSKGEELQDENEASLLSRLVGLYRSLTFIQR